MRYLFVLLLLSVSAVAQPLTQTQKLVSLAKLWGFLKYYHPAVAQGKLDWDGQLIRLLPAVQQAQDVQQLSTRYQSLLDELGPLKPCRKCLSQTEILAENQPNLDLSFLTDSLVFSSPLRHRLSYLRDNHYQGDNYYGKTLKPQAALSFENEKAYDQMALPNADYRLLALFRYWNVIHYFYPYKYALDTNWREVLPKLIPLFEQATTPSAYQLVLYQLTASIQDSHGVMSSKDPARCLRCNLGRLWLPFEVQLLNNKAVITRLYSDSLLLPPFLKIGTIISHIDGETIQARVSRLRPYVSASTPQALLRDMRGLIGAGLEKQASLTLELTGRDTTVLVTCYPYRKLGTNLFLPISSRYAVSSWLTDQIGYVNMGKLMAKQVDSVISALWGAKAIIFDLRNYPQDTYGLVGAHLVNKTLPFARLTGPDKRFPGTFQEVSQVELSPSKPPRQYPGKVIVLINEDTQSQAEFTAMSFRLHPHVTFVGGPTAGADGNMAWVPLPGGYRTAFSSVGVYYPDGRETQRIGIFPDILVQPTVEGIRQDQDEVLEQAKRLLVDR
ncbi:S41 family peptidase [Spirosoma flavum]|uniref:S41 family peptidase n=1 Tax=Spirosoma flavum TaxID=2048557 RepID=A0ABW6AQ51_9BACT